MGVFGRTDRQGAGKRIFLGARVAAERHEAQRKGRWALFTRITH